MSRRKILPIRKHYLVMFEDGSVEKTPYYDGFIYSNLKQKYIGKCFKTFKEAKEYSRRFKKLT